MTDETYNGWTNYETWAFNLHWQNDQGLYLETLETARTYLVETYGHSWAELPADELSGAFYGVGERIRDYWHDMIRDYVDDYGAELPEVLRLFREDVGSFWRVDVAETGSAVREGLGIES